MLRPAAEFLFCGSVTIMFTGRFPLVLSAFILVTVPMFGAAWLLPRLQRLEALLGEPSAEIAELALLPGAGDRKEQGRALLREALVWPMAWEALLLAAVAVGYAMLVGRADAEPVAPLPAVILAAGMLLLYAAMTMGVLARILRPVSLWVALGTPFVFHPALLLAVRDLSAHRGNLSSGQTLAWLLPLVLISVCLAAWARHALRRPWLLYQ
jgi:hypothetical protein